jgi:hypothetical protein
LPVQQAGWRRPRSWGSAIPRSGTRWHFSASPRNAPLPPSDCEVSLRETADGEGPPSAPGRPGRPGRRKRWGGPPSTHEFRSANGESSARPPHPASVSRRTDGLKKAPGRSTLSPKGERTGVSTFFRPPRTLYVCATHGGEKFVARTACPDLSGSLRCGMSLSLPRAQEPH